MRDYGLYQYYITTSTTTARSFYRDDNRDDHIELDDTAPLPLFIGIGLALFIGFVLLVLICCLCRRRRVPSTIPPDRPVNTTHYQRAPVTDGLGVGAAYPLASVPPMSYPNSTIVYAPPHIGRSIQHNYGVIGSGINYSGANHYPLQQPPHFGGVPTYPPAHYTATLPLAPHSTPLQSHSPSHSSQASSSMSGATADPLVPSSSPFIQQQPPQQHHHPHPQQLHQFSQQHMPPASALQHHQHLQQQFLSGRQSPAFHYAPMTYTAMLVSEHPAPPRPDNMAVPSAGSVPQINCPMVNHQPQQMVQSSSYTEEEED